MQTREQMRRDYYRKKRAHTSVRMFLYALGVVGTGFIFQDEAVASYQKVEDFINQNAAALTTKTQGQTASSQTAGQQSVQNVHASPDAMKNVQNVDASVSATGKQSSEPAANTTRSATNNGQSQVSQVSAPAPEVAPITESAPTPDSVPAPEAARVDTSVQSQGTAPAQAPQGASIQTPQTPSVTTEATPASQPAPASVVTKTNDTSSAFTVTEQATPQIPNYTDEQALEMFSHLMEAMNLTAPHTMTGGLSGRLSDLQDGNDGGTVSSEQSHLPRFLSPFTTDMYAAAQARAEGANTDESLQTNAGVQAPMDLTYVRGAIKQGSRVSKESSSFTESAAKAGLTPAQITFLTRTLAGDIELGEMKPGDTFEIVTEKAKEGAEPQILYVGLNIKGQEYHRFVWEDEKGVRGFYTPEGKLPQKNIMTHPVEFYKRVSSSFGMRTHPIDGGIKEHKGVDLALPTGTPIKAAADGVVTHAGTGTGYGKYIVIKHANGFTTRYAHLSAYEKGVKAGARVKAGQNIGKGGNTGINRKGEKSSTGSHLHFEVRINGEAVNPLKSYKLSPSKTLQPAQLDAFLAKVDTICTESLMDHPMGKKALLAAVSKRLATKAQRDNTLARASAAPGADKFVSSVMTVPKGSLKNVLKQKSRIPMVSFGFLKKDQKGT